MKILNFVRRLNGKVTSDGVLTDISSIKEQLDEVLVPSINKYKKMEEDRSTKPKDVIRYTGTILKNIDGSRRTISETLERKMPDIISNLEVLENQYTKEFKSISSLVTGLSSKKAVFIANLSMYRSFLDYTMNLLDACSRVYAAKAAKKAGKSLDLYEIDKFNNTYLDEQVLNYTSVLNHLSMKTKDFKKKLDAQVDIELTDENAEYAEASGVLPELPFKKSFTGGLFYSMFKWKGEWAASTYKVNKSKRRSLELMVMDLDQSKEGKSNAAIDREIKYTRDRISKLDYEIRDFEESLDD